MQTSSPATAIGRAFHWFKSPPTDGAASITILRIMAGSVFLWEGILKIVYANQGLGRFTKLGFPFPEATADFVTAIEIGGGLAILLGLATRFIAVTFIIEMLVAMLSTKIALYLGTSPLPVPASPPKVGAWAVLHEIRSEWAQLATSAYLLVAGPGRWSLDAWLANARARRLTDGKSEPRTARASGLSSPA